MIRPFHRTAVYRLRGALFTPMLLSLLTLTAAVTAPQSRADTLTVAVASNFAETLELLAERFHDRTGHQVRLVRGSSGRHFAQIMNGAPFDLFFSADASRPATLVSQLGLPAERLHTYALGRLVLWTRSQLAGEAILNQLKSMQFHKLAIANPRLAPYGQAALEALQEMHMDDLLDKDSSRLLRGENVAQTFQFVSTGNAELGFVALSQAQATGDGSYWLVPDNYYQPITQQLVMLNDSSASHQLVDFLSTPEARAIVEKSGYRLPESVQ